MNEDYAMEDTDAPPADANANTVAQGPTWVAPPGPLDNVHGDSDGAVLIVASWDSQTATPERIQAFLARWPPSRTPLSYCSWIAVDRGRQQHQRPPPDIPGLSASFQALVASDRVGVPEIDRIAAAHGVLAGKWLVYGKTHEIDELWGRVVGVVVCAGLGRGTAKVSPKREEENSHVICVYVEDYRDEMEVGVLREALRAVGVFWRIGFKPDAYTHLGIYAKNEWGIRPSRYFG